MAIRTMGDHDDKRAAIKVPSPYPVLFGQIPVGARHSDMQLNTVIKRVVLQPNTEAAIR